MNSKTNKKHNSHKKKLAKKLYTQFLRKRHFDHFQNDIFVILNFNFFIENEYQKILKNYSIYKESQI